MLSELGPVTMLALTEQNSFSRLDYKQLIMSQKKCVCAAVNCSEQYQGIFFDWYFWFVTMRNIYGGTMPSL